MKLVVRQVGPEAAGAMWPVVRAAFEARPPLDPPADALADTPESLAAALEAGGGLLAELDGTPVGSLVFDRTGTAVFLRRFAVVPAHQRNGVAQGLLVHAFDSIDSPEIAVVARTDLPDTIRFWQERGFRETRRDPPYAELRRSLSATYDAPDADSMRALGTQLAARLRAGDLVVLVGELGAGKTTLAQGLGAGLGVRGDVTSPTFVISRVHPSLDDGPDLVHVDAYRLGGLRELDDLDLDASLDDAVTIVEWGEGLAEALSNSRVEVRIERAIGSGPDADLDPRRVTVRGYGPRWVRDVPW